MPIVFVGALLVQDPLKLRREIDDWMANYDERQEEKKRLARETQVGDSLCFFVVKGTPRKTKIQPEHRPKPQKEIKGKDRLPKHHFSGVMLNFGGRLFF